MDSARSVVAATTTAATAPGTTPVRPQADAANDTSAFFANLLQKVGGQFFNAASLVDPSVLPTVVTPPENRAPETKTDASAPAKDAAEKIVGNYGVLPASSDTASTTRAGAPQIHDVAPGNTV